MTGLSLSSLYALGVGFLCGLPLPQQQARLINSGRGRGGSNNPKSDLKGFSYNCNKRNFYYRRSPAFAPESGPLESAGLRPPQLSSWVSRWVTILGYFVWTPERSKFSEGVFFFPKLHVGSMSKAHFDNIGKAFSATMSHFEGSLFQDLHEMKKHSEGRNYLSNYLSELWRQSLEKLCFLRNWWQILNPICLWPSIMIHADGEKSVFFFFLKAVQSSASR